MKPSTVCWILFFIINIVGVAFSDSIPEVDMYLYGFFVGCLSMGMLGLKDDFKREGK